jgi:hypothetical protein
MTGTDSSNLEFIAGYLTANEPIQPIGCRFGMARGIWTVHEWHIHKKKTYTIWTYRQVNISCFIM